MVKRLSEMQETRVQSLGWEDPLEKEMATHLSILAWELHGWRSLADSAWDRKNHPQTTLTERGRVRRGL